MRHISELIGTTTNSPGFWGLRADDLVYGGGVSGRDRRTGELPAEAAGQAEVALAMIEARLREYDADLAAVARIGFHLRDPGDIRLINRVWTRRFPDELDRPTYKFLRADLDGAHLVELDFFAVLGQRRQCLYLPKVAHGNPIPMAVRMGGYLFTSRVLPLHPDTGEPGRDGVEQALLAVRNVGTLLEQSGLTWRNVQQGRAFVADPDDDVVVRALWDEHVGPADFPPLHITRYRAGALSVLIEIIAAA